MRVLFVAFMLFSAPLLADTQGDIRAALAYFAEVWNEGDLETIRGYYHSDFMLIGEEGKISLQQRIGDLEAIAVAGEDAGTLEHSQVSVKLLGTEHAMAYGQRKLSFEDGSGFESWFSTIYVKTPFGWKAILTHN